jgi:hypothetical protein
MHGSKLRLCQSLFQSIGVWPFCISATLSLCADVAYARESEQELAEKYAPIVFHEIAEPNLPTNVDDFLAHTALFYYDDVCVPPVDEKIESPVTQSSLCKHVHELSCGSAGRPVRSGGTLSDDKRTTFYLADLDAEGRKGSADSTRWTTYFHYYPTDKGAVIQYWRFYAYNTGKTVGELASETLPDLWNRIPHGLQHLVGTPMAGFHGGDWEGVQLVLDDNYLPIRVWLLGHTTIQKMSWAEMSKQGFHIKVKAELGGHASAPFAGIDESGYIRQECWSGGTVKGAKFGFVLSKTGGLVNLGQKIAPLNGQLFIQYSGLWGSPSRSHLAVDDPLLPGPIRELVRKLASALYPLSSGYWGPAFNETEKVTTDDFITAWGHDMLTPEPTSDGLTECHPQTRLQHP